MPTRSVFKRHPANPIVTPGGPAWRSCVTFNPGVILENGKFYMYERAGGQLRPFINYIGMLESDDGVHFESSHPEPVLTPEMIGSKIGSVQDPRVVKIDGVFYMTFAYRPYAWHSNPTGVGVPESHQPEVPGWDGDPRTNQTRSGIATSTNLHDWTFHSFVNGPEIDDRDVILFPEKIGGRYVVLRRPLGFVDSSHKNAMPGLIQMSFSEDLKTWTPPQVVVEPKFAWENNRIGGSTPPIKTDEGWLIIYHGVETVDRALRKVIYRAGVLMLDLEDPTRVVSRHPDFIMEPEEYYERFGVYIPNVVFPTANVVKDGTVYLYYGCCDTAIGLATASLKDLVDLAMNRAGQGHQ